MLKAARAHGRPMTVIAMITAATTQATAIHKPPNTIQSRLRSRLITGMSSSPSTAEIAEFAVQIEIARGDLTFHLAESRLEVGKLAFQGVQRVGRRGADAAPERLLVGAGIERRWLRSQHQRQDDIGDDRRREEEDETEHRDKPYDDRFDADVGGDPGAHAGDDAAIGVAPQAIARAAAVGPDHPLSSRLHAPARRFAVEHFLERLDAPFHPPRALPQLAQRLLVIARQPARLPPLREVVADDPDRRDNNKKEDPQDQESAVEEHGALPSLAGGLRVNAIAEPLLQRPQLLLDAALRLEPCKFVREGLLAAEIEGLDLALHFVERTLDVLEAGKGVGDALVIEVRAQLDAVDGSLLPRGDRLLAHLGVGELGLQLADVLVLLGECILDLLALMLQRRERLDDARLGEERTLGEVFTSLGDRELGAALPFLLFALERADPALDFFLLGDGAHGRGAYLDQRVLHLLNDEPNDLLRILGAVEDGVDVGVHDVGEARKNPHAGHPCCRGDDRPCSRPPKQAPCQCAWSNLSH